VSSASAVSAHGRAEAKLVSRGKPSSLPAQVGNEP